VLFYPGVRLPIPVLLQYRVDQLLNRLKPDVIHVQDHFLLTRAVIRANRKLNIPIIGTNHFMTENITALLGSGKWARGLGNRMWAGFSDVYNKLSLVTTPTETAARLIRPKLNVDVVAISSGIDFGKFNPYGGTEKIKEKYSLPDRPFLLYVGRLDPEKRIEDVLRAVALVVWEKDFCFLIVGKGIRKPALERLAGELRISDRVIFTGFVPEEDLPYLYKLSRCFIIASIAELLSLGTLQAMASGLPVIAANAGALPELVHDKLNGYLFDPGDIDAMVRCIRDIFSDDVLCSKMSKYSLKYIAHHDIRRTADLFEGVYQRIAGGSYLRTAASANGS
jgi:glycosyltransferase involved in cell wall biosynthesis